MIRRVCNNSQWEDVSFQKLYEMKKKKKEKMRKF